MFRVNFLVYEIVKLSRCFIVLLQLTDDEGKLNEYHPLAVASSKS